MTLALKDIRFRYGRTLILDSVSLELDSSKMVALCGPNGVGKSTLIKCINTILKPEGAVFLDGQDIKKMKRPQIARRFGYVPQELGQLFATKVFDMVLMGRRPHVGWRSSAGDRDKVLNALQMMGIEELAMRDFHELSGGQRQKVIIARALAQDPKVLLMDEPTSDLDLHHQLEVMDLIRSLVETEGLSVVMSVHDLNLAARYADQVVMMKDGRIHCAGKAETVLTPENILTVYNVIAEVQTILGRPHVIPVRPLSMQN